MAGGDTGASDVLWDGERGRRLPFAHVRVAKICCVLAARVFGKAGGGGVSGGAQPPQGERRRTLCGRERQVAVYIALQLLSRERRTAPPPPMAVLSRDEILKAIDQKCVPPSAADLLLRAPFIYCICHPFQKTLVRTPLA